MKFLVLGGSRGLGAEIMKQLSAKGYQALSFSRKNNFDFSKQNNWLTYLEKFKSESPHAIIYSAGGGPYGKFADKEFHAHEWAWRVNFYFPAFLLHDVLRNQNSWPDLKKICFIGSAIAESKPDPMAASYAAAKHALRGLVTSVQGEGTGTVDVQIFSPGYMDTAMLPANAWPRSQEGLVKSPQQVAEDFLKSLL